MKARTLWLSIGGAVVLSALMIAGAYAGPTDVTQIQELEKRFAAAVEAKDVNAIMANYIPGEDLHVFDVIPPREYKGADAYKKDWAGVLEVCKDAPKVEISDIVVNAGSKYAFGHNIQHFTCTDAKGNKLDMTLRVTDGYEKINGKWLIAHEHISVPVDITTAKADLSSKP